MPWEQRNRAVTDWLGATGLVVSAQRLIAERIQQGAVRMDLDQFYFALPTPPVPVAEVQGSILLGLPVKFNGAIPQGQCFLREKARQDEVATIRSVLGSATLDVRNVMTIHLPYYVSVRAIDFDNVDPSTPVTSHCITLEKWTRNATQWSWSTIFKNTRYISQVKFGRNIHGLHS